MYKRSRTKILPKIIAIAVVIVLLFGAIYFIKNRDPEIKPSENYETAKMPEALVISEVVASNAYSFTAPDGTSPDWIEIYNGTGSTVNLSGYGLTDDATNQFKFAFPSIYLESGEYLLVLCTGDEDKEPEDDYLKAGFKLSAEMGETIVFSDPYGKTLDSVPLFDMQTDISYGRTTDGWSYYGLPTPGEVNGGPSNKDGKFEGGLVESDLVINEFMADNKYSIVDSQGERVDWVEIKNTGSKKIDLSGYGLSDDKANTKKWTFPEGTELDSGAMMIVFLSTKEGIEGELHADFSLSVGETLVLAESHGKIVDSAAVEDIGGNISKGKLYSADGKIDKVTWVYYTIPTPGEENTTKYFNEITESAERYLPDVRINETKTVQSASSDETDWIELYNTTSSSIDISGYGLSDNLDNPFAYVIPSGTTISANGYYVAEISDTSPLGLSYAGETLYLSSPNGTVTDKMSTGYQTPAVSSGIAQSGEASDTRVFFNTATKGAENSSSYLFTYAQKPRFSVAGGYVSKGTKVAVTAAEGAEIYYTTDGSKPTANSKKYSGEITVNESMPIRAIAVENGKITSDVTTENYLVENKHDIPVVCISVKPDDMFGSTNGIYANGPGYVEVEGEVVHKGANYWKDWEREINFEFFEADGTKGVDFNAGIKIFGQYSREEAQKSFAIYLRGTYGLDAVTYPFFRDYDVTTFSSLILRTSGQDWKYTKLRDAFFCMVCKDTMDLDYMEYRPVAVYINGEYWGLYNLREKQNEDYLVNHYGVDPDNVDIIKGNSNVQAGSNAANMKLREYVQTHNLSQKEPYEYVCSQVDVDHFMDYIIAETFFNNTDTGNIRIWKEKDTGKWRWMLFDMDWGIFPSTYKWNMIEEFFNASGHGVGDRFYSHMQMGLLQNTEWKNKFIERYAWHLQNTFKYERMETILDAMVDEIDAEMERHIKRWNQPSSMESWKKTIESFKRMLSEKVGITKEDLQQFFGLSNARMQQLFNQ